MTSKIPFELLTHILSYLPIRDAYLARAVNTLWKRSAEQSLYYILRSKDSTALVRFGRKKLVQLSLHAYSYDDVEGVIEFRPTPGSDTPGSDIVPVPARSSNTSTLFPREMQVLCSEWCIDLPAPADAQDPIYLFHGRYNPAVERVIPTSPWHPGDRLIGDADFILSLTILPGGDSSAPLAGTATADTPPPPPLLVRVNYLRVTPSWLVSGISYTPPYVHPIQIYPARHARLTSLLAAQGITRYDPTLDSVLRWIVSVEAEAAIRDPEANVTLPPELITTLQHATHEFYARTPLALLVHHLERAGAEPRALWKYNAAKTFVTGTGLLDVEEVVRAVLENEEKGRKWLEERKKLK